MDHVEQIRELTEDDRTMSGAMAIIHKHAEEIKRAARISEDALDELLKKLIIQKIKAEIAAHRAHKAQSSSVDSPPDELSSTSDS